MEIKLLALDMDGTTLQSDHVTVSSANRLAIETAIRRGIIVVTATGRMKRRIPKQIETLPGVQYAITSNGAAVIDLLSDQLLFSTPLSCQKALEVIDSLGGLDVYIETYCNGKSYTQEDMLPLFDQFPLVQTRMEMMRRDRYAVDSFHKFLTRDDLLIEKVNMPYLPPALQPSVRERLKLVSGIAVTSSVADNAEVNAQSANKANGLSRLCHMLGIPPEQVMAIGDSHNDREMLEFAGLAVAPSNAEKEILDISDYITRSNDEDAVAQAIEMFLL